jgi:branched-chain amino acid transport system ATP-binding protein
LPSEGAKRPSSERNARAAAAGGVEKRSARERARVGSARAAAAGGVEKGSARAAAGVPLLELRGVRAAYEKVEVLHGVDLVVAGGSLVAVLGPNGAGKTTTLRVMSGLMKPTDGQVLFEGFDVTGASAEELSRTGVCLIPEGRGIFPNLTVRENILMDTFGQSRRVGELEDLVFDTFPALRDRRDQIAGTLSGGEQQMLSLSRAMSTDPAVILLDEVSMGLAPIIVENLFGIVRKLTRTGVTIVVVEQFADVVLDFADSVALMAQGRVRAFGPPSKVRDEIESTYLGAG